MTINMTVITFVLCCNFVVFFVIFYVILVGDGGGVWQLRGGGEGAALVGPYGFPNATAYTRALLSATNY